MMGNIIFLIIVCGIIAILGVIYFLVAFISSKIGRLKRDLSYAETVALNLRDILIANSKEQNKQFQRINQYLYTLNNELKEKDKYYDPKLYDEPELEPELVQEKDQEQEQPPFIEVYKKQIEESGRLYNLLKEEKTNINFSELLYMNDSGKDTIPTIWR